jgi:hypothetical protein
VAQHTDVTRNCWEERDYLRNSCTKEKIEEDSPDMHQVLKKKGRKYGSKLSVAGFDPMILSRFKALILAGK